MSKLQSVSVEFSAPRKGTRDEVETFRKTVRDISRDVQPGFITLTFHAQTAAQRRHFPGYIAILQETSRPVTAHLTYYNIPRLELRELAVKLKNQGVKSILALRGDSHDDQKEPKDKYIHRADHLVAALKAVSDDFQVIVTAYPRRHAETKIRAQDIQALRDKWLAGADTAITQVFFDNDDFYRLRDDIEKAGIDIRLLPGLLPIADFSKTQRFAGKCKIYLPPGLEKEFRKASTPEDTLKIGEELLFKQAEDLTRHGVGHLHFYSLNAHEPMTGAIRRLRD